MLNTNYPIVQAKRILTSYNWANVDHRIIHIPSPLKLLIIKSHIYTTGPLQKTKILYCTQPNTQHQYNFQLPSSLPYQSCHFFKTKRVYINSSTIWKKWGRYFEKKCVLFRLFVIFYKRSWLWFEAGSVMYSAMIRWSADVKDCWYYQNFKVQEYLTMKT